MKLVKLLAGSYSSIDGKLHIGFECGPLTEYEATIERKRFLKACREAGMNGMMVMARDATTGKYVSIG